MAARTRLYEDETLVVTQNDNLLVCSWLEAPTLAQMITVGKHVDRWRQTFGDDVAFVNVILGGKVEDFSNEARVEANQMTERFPRNLCTAHVVLVGGLPGMLARTILRAMRLIGRHQSPWRVFDNCAVAAEWIALILDGHAGRRWTPAEVLNTLNR